VGVAYLLWFFLGVLGVHRFYCGLVVSGFVWFFTGGLFGIGWLVDVFLIPGMVEKANAEKELRTWAGQYSPDNPAQPTMTGVADGHRVIYCTSCGCPMQVSIANTAGQQVRCPSCGKALAVPA